MEKALWVLTNPDNRCWDGSFARKELDRLAKKWNIKIRPAWEIKNFGAGREEKFFIEGRKEDILFFEEEWKLENKFMELENRTRKLEERIYRLEEEINKGGRENEVDNY